MRQGAVGRLVDIVARRRFPQGSRTQSFGETNPCSKAVTTTWSREVHPIRVIMVDT